MLSIHAWSYGSKPPACSRRDVSREMLSTISFGCSVCNRSMICRLHVSHSVYLRASDGVPWASPALDIRPWPPSPAASAGVRRPAGTPGSTSRHLSRRSRPPWAKQCRRSRTRVGPTSRRLTAHLSSKGMRPVSDSGSSVGKGGIEIGGDVVEGGGCRDGGLYLGEIVLHYRVVLVDGPPIRGGPSVMVSVWVAGCARRGREPRPAP